jgi:S-formylglutathione hydrolase FrmB
MRGRPGRLGRLPNIGRAVAHPGCLALAALLTLAGWSGLGARYAAAHAAAVRYAATAFPSARAAADGSRLTAATPTGPRRWTLSVYSAAMNRVIELQVIRPADTATPAPTLYLLDGAEDGIGQGGRETTWETKTDIVGFVADKHVNVVTLVDGKYSYYTDWRADDPVLGRNRWTTFLTRELPPVVDSALRTTGRNAIAGVSMSATSALSLAEAAPGLYRSVGSFSGCDVTSTDPGRRFVQAVVLSGGGNPVNMWGPDGDPAWAANDPSTDANLVKLRGVNVFVAAGDGKPGPHDTLPGPVVMSGSALERTVGECTADLRQRMHRLGMPATFRMTPTGTHSWPYWQDDLHAAWPSFARSLGL